MPHDEISADETALPARKADEIVASGSVVFGTLSLCALGIVVWLTVTRTPTLWWVGPVCSLGGLVSWATGVALGGVALGSSAGRRALAGLAVCALAAACFAVMVFVLDVAP